MPIKTEYIESLLHTTSLTVYVILICLTIIGSVYAIRTQGVKRGFRSTVGLMLVMYIIYVLCTTVLFRPDGCVHDIKYTPFWSYARVKHIGSRIVQENLMNVIAFMPIGIMLKLYWSRIKWWNAAIVGGCLSVLIELMQFFFEKGQCEIDDVIHNTFGCIFGFFIVKFVLRLYKVNRFTK